MEDRLGDLRQLVEGRNPLVASTMNSTSAVLRSDGARRGKTGQRRPDDGRGGSGATRRQTSFATTSRGGRARNRERSKSGGAGSGFFAVEDDGSVHESGSEHGKDDDEGEYTHRHRQSRRRTDFREEEGGSGEDDDDGGARAATRDAENGQLEHHQMPGSDDDEKEEKHPEFMKVFLQQIGVVKAALSEVEKNVNGMRELKGEALSATSPEVEKGISHTLNKLIDTTNLLIFKIKRGLERLKAENEEIAKLPQHASEAKMRVNILQVLTQKLRDLIMAFQTAQTEYKHDVQQKMTRQVKVVYPEASPEEVQQLVEAGDVSSAAALRLRVSSNHQSLRNALSDIQDKYRDVRRLEQSVAELHQLFVEMAFLVEQQGELLNRIEYSVNRAEEYTAKADVELVQARKNQRSAKRRMCCVFGCLLVLLVVIMVPVLLVVLK